MGLLMKWQRTAGRRVRSLVLHVMFRTLLDPQVETLGRPWYKRLQNHKGTVKTKCVNLETTGRWKNVRGLRTSTIIISYKYYFPVCSASCSFCQAEFKNS